MKYSALIPVKPLNSAKSRLDSLLSPQQRKKLVLAMFSHIVQTLAQTNLFSTIFTASADRTVLDFAAQNNSSPLFIEQKNLNTDLKEAVRAAKLAAHVKLLTISSDLPLVTSDDIKNIVKLSETSDLVIAPAKRNSGTNALFCKPLVIPYLFGKGSLEKFAQAALEKKVSLAMYNSPTIAFDVDTPEDLKKLLSQDKSYAALLKAKVK